MGFSALFWTIMADSSSTACGYLAQPSHCSGREQRKGKKERRRESENLKKSSEAR
jgi:hypothetical protein